MLGRSFSMRDTSPCLRPDLSARSVCVTSSARRTSANRTASMIDAAFFLARACVRAGSLSIHSCAGRKSDVFSLAISVFRLQPFDEPCVGRTDHVLVEPRLGDTLL